MQLAENTGHKNDAKNRHLGTIAQLLSGSMFSTKACIDNRKKNLLSSNISSTCSYNMVNFVPLAAEFVSLVWGTPANFNGFCVLASLLQQRRSTEANQTARCLAVSHSATLYTFLAAVAL